MKLSEDRIELDLVDVKTETKTLTLVYRAFDTPVSRKYLSALDFASKKRSILEKGLLCR